MNDRHSEFLWNVHSYINEYVRFADAKALAVVAWTSALLGVLVSNKTFDYFLDGKLTSGTWFLAWSTLAGYSLLAAGFTMAIAVIAPYTRHAKDSPHGLIFWEAVRSHGSSAEYANAVEEANNLAERVAAHIFELSTVASLKFTRVKFSIWLAAAGTLPAILAIFY